MLRSTKTREPVANLLLAALPGKEYQRLRPHLEEVTLAFGEVLYESGEIIRRVYFPNHGIVSLLSKAWSASRSSWGWALRSTRRWCKARARP